MRRQSGRFRSSFTLIELLLVLAIIAVVSAVVMPSFVRSLRGNRLRVAVRTVVMAGRYARSMAVLRQKPMLITLDLRDGRILVDDAGGAERRPAGPPDEAPGDRSADAPAEPPAEVSPAPGWEIGVERKLDRVRIERVEFEGGENRVVTEGICHIPYFTQGTCPPHRIRVSDEHGEALTVVVDALGAADVSTEAK